jgi:hypothetical protein
MLRAMRLLIALLLATCACGGVGGRADMSTGGVLASRPQCGALNVACVGQKLDAPIALGSTLELDVRYQIAGSSGPPTVLETADPAVLTIEGSHLKAVGAGASAVLFIGPDKVVLDFLHLWVEPATELRILRYSSAGTLIGRVQNAVKLLVHDELLVSIEPFAKGQPLIGNFKLESNVAGNTVAIVPDSVSGFHRVVARSPGTSQIKLSALGLSIDWTIEVLP